MTRWGPLRALLLVALVLPAALAALPLVGDAAGVERTTSTTDAVHALGEETATGLLPHFAYRVLGQTTGVSKVITGVTGGTTTPNVAPGNAVVFQVSVTGATPNTSITVQDFLGSEYVAPSSLTIVSGTATCSLAGSPTTPPSGADPAGTQYQCTVQTDGSGNATFSFAATVESTAPAGSSVATGNVACAPAAPGAAPNCSPPAQANVVPPLSPTPLPTAQPTPGTACTRFGFANLTPIGGFGAVGQVETVRVSSALVNAEISGLLPGQVPSLTIPTTVGNEVISGGLPPGPGAPVTIQGITSGNPLQGGLVTLTVGGSVVAQGTLQCSDVPNPGFPLPPPALPPLLLVPPPPPPFPPGPGLIGPGLLPPPPPAPGGPFGEPPIIPEADSLALVGGGLLALGGIVAYRRWRRPGGPPR